MDDRKARRAAVALAAAAALAWAALRPGPNPPSAPIAATPEATPDAPIAPTAPTPKPTSARNPTQIAAKPLERGAGLRDPGEAFGGKAPERVEPSTSSARRP